MKLTQSLLMPDGGHQLVGPQLRVVMPLPSSAGIAPIPFPACGHLSGECPS